MSESASTDVTGKEPPPLPDLSAIVVSYNSASYLRRCLDCLAASEGVRLRIIVVDNASSDDSVRIAREHPARPRVIALKKNKGFAGGNNIGFRAAKSTYVAMVNPDCDVESETLARLLAPLERDPMIGATGAKLLYPDRNVIQHAGGVLHPQGTCDHLGVGEEDQGQHDGEREVDYVTGALAAYRLAEVRALGGLDREYHPAYYEETDLCERLRRSGRRILYVGSARARHWESVEVGGRTSPRLVELMFRNRLVFLVKNRSVCQLLLRVLPAEIKWLLKPFPPGHRKQLARSYLGGALFALRCAARFDRRPKGVLPRLPPTA